MNTKSFVSREQKQCFVCGELFETNSLLIDNRLKNSLEKFTVTGYGLCETHQKMADDDYIACIVVLQNKERTGDFVHLRKEFAERIFKQKFEKKIAFIDVDIFNLLADLNKQTNEEK